jgi:DNA repair protein RecN (Recombination protein N)
MLKELRIKNLAIIDDLTVSFGEGLNVLTGETGAGKSIIVDSLGLALGSRAQSDMVRSGEKEAVVEAYFELQDTHPLPDIGIDISDGLIIRRSVSATGKSRAYINDSLVSLQGVTEIGRLLVDIHGQHEHQSLLSVDKHRLLLDSFGRLSEDRKKVEELYCDLETLRKELHDLTEKASERAQRIDLLKFQIREIDASALKPGEKEGLLEERQILSNAGKLKESAETAYAALYGSEGSCTEKLSLIISKAKEMSAVDHGVTEILNMLESARPLIEDASVSLRGYKDRYDIEPERLNDVEERLELIKKLEKKYGEGTGSILNYRDEALRELDGHESVNEKLDAIEAGLKHKQDNLLAAAETLSEKRKQVAAKMEKLIRNELKGLSLNNAEFVIDIKEGDIAPHGSDKIEFLFSANPGEPPKPLVKIASGGELSRVMLALKSIFADFDGIPVLIFDEVDAGIGGKTAESVGEKLKTLSAKHQVLCATHLPQIASMGESHLKVEKGQKDGKVHIEVKEISGMERLHEIARMMSGKITDISLKHAKELLDSAAIHHTASGKNSGLKGLFR